MLLKSKNIKYSLSAASVLVAAAFTSAHAESYNKVSGLKDDSYVTLSGTVGKIIDEDEFNLVTSSGTIKVDTNDDWPMLSGKTPSTPYLQQGDKVTVTGQVDDNYFSRKEIDATSISTRNGTYSTTYRSNDIDYNAWWQTSDDYDDQNIRLSGSVGKILDDNEFMLNYNGGTIRVDISDARNDSTDNLRVGQSVSVLGTVEDDWYESKEIEATQINSGYNYDNRS